VKKLLLLIVFGFISGSVYADVSIISVTPKYVTVYQTVCESNNNPEPNGTGALIGGVLGGVAGHQIGDGSGQTAATIAGTLLGQRIGQNINRGTRCWREPYQEQRGEIVTFEYNGRRFTHVFE